MSDDDITAIFSSANTILSQASIELAMPTTAGGNLVSPRPVIAPEYFDVTELGASHGYAGSIDDLIHFNKSPLVDIFFVRTYGGGNVGAETIFPGEHTSFDNFNDPGIVVQTYFSSTGAGGIISNRQLGRTIAHEIIHYIIRKGDSDHTDDLPYSLFAGGTKGIPTKRDINDDLLINLHANNTTSTTTPDN